VKRQTDNNKRNNNVNSGDSEDGEDNRNSSGSIDKINIRQKGRKGIDRDSAEKVTRSSTRGESGSPGKRLQVRK
jgi:hypothetical protein